MVTLAPSCASLSAIAAPMPRLAPVMMAVLPVSVRCSIAGSRKVLWDYS